MKCHVTLDRTSLASSYFYMTRISQDDLTAEAWTACGATVFFFFFFPLHGAEGKSQASMSSNDRLNDRLIDSSTIMTLFEH